MKKCKKIIIMCMLGILLFQCFGVTSYAAEKENKEQVTPSGVTYSEIGALIEDYVDEHKETTVGMSVAVYDENGTIPAKTGL